MPTPTVYTSADTGAPSVTGAQGEFIAMLEACLVTGYGSKTAAGWSKPYSGTGKAVFRPAGGNQFYLRVVDGVASGSNYLASLRGYESMTDVDTGTNPFPTTAQVAGDGMSLTYNTGNVARPWVVVADDRTALIFADPASTQNYRDAYFGDIYSYVTADGYRTILIVEYLAYQRDSTMTTFLDAMQQHYMARAYTGVAGALQVGKHADASKSQAAVGTDWLNVGIVPFPNPADDRFYLSPWYIHEPTSKAIRGELRGYWHWVHPVTSLGDRDTFVGTGDFAGRSFLVVGRDATNAAVHVIETSATWRTN